MKVNFENPTKNNFKEFIKIDPWDTWGLDTTLAAIIHPALIEFKKNTHGYPADFDEDIDYNDEKLRRWNGQYLFYFMNIRHDSNLTEQEKKDIGIKKWYDAIDKMIFSFECIKHEDWPFYSVPTHLQEEYQTLEGLTSDIQQGLDLFAKYYINLWD